MIPLSNKNLTFTNDEINTLYFSLHIFIESDFSKVASRKQDQLNKKIAKSIIKKIENNSIQFSNNEIRIMSASVNNFISMLSNGDFFDNSIEKHKMFLPALDFKLDSIIENHILIGG